MTCEDDRRSTGTWFVLASTQGAASLAWGSSTDVPLPGDYDGDGNVDVAVYRPSTGTWLIFGSSVGSASIAWGSSVDVAVPADYDGDGKADIAVFRPGTGTWNIIQSATSTVLTIGWGISGDKPVSSPH